MTPPLSCFQSEARITLRHLSTSDTGLRGNKARLVQLSSGRLIIRGQTAVAGYSPLFAFDPAGEKWVQLRPQLKLCQHERDAILALTIHSQDYMAISCGECQNIKLFNVEREEITTAFCDSKYNPGKMCLGETGEMFVLHKSVEGERDILQLNCATPTFSFIRSIKFSMTRHHSLCYVPGHKVIVISSIAGLVRAVSCEREETVSEVTGQVDGRECSPYGLLFSQSHNALFVADGRNTRILVINPGSGCVRQVLPLDPEMSEVRGLCGREGQLFVRHCANQEVKVSHFTVR